MAKNHVHQRRLQHADRHAIFAFNRVAQAAEVELAPRRRAG